MADSIAPPEAHRHTIPPCRGLWEPPPDDSTTTATLYERPIVVGYVFGPKKMSTMGVVMAEASQQALAVQVPRVGGTGRTTGRRRSSRTTTAREDPHDDDDGLSSPPFVDGSTAPTRTTSARTTTTTTTTQPSVSSSSVSSPMGLTQARLWSHHQTATPHDPSLSSSTTQGRMGSRSSSASVASSGGTKVTVCSSTRSSADTGERDQDAVLVPLRVSFVPLDPEIPLHEQHGGQMDVILHKLTEDILCLSKLQAKDTTLAHTNTPSSSLLATPQRAAVRRVQRLVDFSRDHPLSLVDRPLAVQTLMSRADIARTLASGLQHVYTTHGLPVRAPRSAVCHSGGDVVRAAMADGHPPQNQNSGVLSFPLMCKPLTAAGTKASHAMAVLLNPQGALDFLAGGTAAGPGAPPQPPWLVQEYSNHDALLYKVYVLGGHVSVHERRSLPNLPRCGPTWSGQKNHVEFDSQKPYPRLSDFGFGDGRASETTSRKRSHTTASTTSDTRRRRRVTVEEIMPVVTALKRAFGLELFGFDILICSNSSHGHDRDTGKNDDGGGGGGGKDRSAPQQEQHMLVVDVNYFPSYKELPNFPELLARYLTERALESRRMAASIQARTNDSRTTVEPF